MPEKKAPKRGKPIDAHTVALNESEHSQQMALFIWAQTQYEKWPELRKMFAIPNGGARDAATGARLKAEGVKPGVPDILLPVARQSCHGLFIEMKRVRVRRPGDTQLNWHSDLQSEGYRVALCNGFLQAKEAIEEYMQ